VASIVSPMYISEISPAKSRGRMVALYQFFLTIGILLAYLSNAWIHDFSLKGSHEMHNGFFFKVFREEYWRAMLGSEAIPALLFLLLLVFIPRSPRWLISKNKITEARQYLEHLHGTTESVQEIEEIKQVVTHEKSDTRALFQKGIRKALLIGVFLALLTQLSGINAIIYYGPKILQNIGLGTGDALGNQVIIGAVNVLFTIIALWKIDSFGRKKLLIVGISGILLSLSALGVLFQYYQSSYNLILFFITLFIACFAFSYGPVIWVLLSEIYPTKIRGRAMGIATFSLWIGTAFIGQMVPYFLELLNASGTFWLFMILTLPALFITVFALPETKGKSLEEIEKYWTREKRK
jgi:sugar porter (SP) family MFS transporter